MTTVIAHLSDLHFGDHFDANIWRSVSDAICDYRPQILIVSGDLVDHPWPDALNEAKLTLDKLAARAKAKLLVVPGNHDLFVSGIAELGKRRDCYDRIFNDNNAARDEVQPPEAPGFRERGSLTRWFDRLQVWRGVSPPAVPPPRPDGTSALILHEDILFALIDSNATDHPIGLATGSVSERDLQALDRELGKLENEVKGQLARIAVVHHHVLPIAHTDQRYVGTEPSMVLHNAGDLLAVLARHRFDLVMHGHKHRAQFARIDFAPDTPEGYPIAVASAGSAALRTPRNPQGNNFNLITIEKNGRLVVESLHYGSGGMGPRRNGKQGEEVKKHREPFDSVKRRAFIRASDCHPIRSTLRQMHFIVSEGGDLVLKDTIDGLWKTRGNGEYKRRPQIISMSRGHLALDMTLDAEALNERYDIIALESSDATRIARAVVLPRPLGEGRPAKYTVSCGLANSISMTLWEMEERARAAERSGKARSNDWDNEYVGGFVDHPTDKIVIRLRLPPSFADVRPRLRCQRRRGFPNFKPNAYGVVDSAGAEYDDDDEMQEEEERALYYDRFDNEWHLVIHRPMVGYRYRLYWRLPDGAPAEPIPSQTLEWRKMLLSMADRATPTERDKRAAMNFALLAEEFRKCLGSGADDEKYALSFFVYDSTQLMVRPVFWHSSPAPTWDWRRFKIPLGDGLAGAAFLQRGLMPWAQHRSDQARFVSPVANPLEDFESQTMLAVPVYHKLQGDETSPSLWATIGVVSFGSSDLATNIPLLLNPSLSREDEERLRLLRGLSQTHVHSCIDVLRGPVPA